MPCVLIAKGCFWGVAYDCYPSLLSFIGFEEKELDTFLREKHKI